MAVGTALAGGQVVVGGDLRPSTAPLKAALIGGLMGSGRQVIDVGVLPTPAFYFAKDYLHAEGGGLAYAAIEIRQDQIQSKRGQAEWADRLYHSLGPILENVDLSTAWGQVPTEQAL